MQSKQSECVCMLSHVQLFVTSCTAARQVRLSMEFSRQEYWSGLPFPSPGDLPNIAIELVAFLSPALASRFFTISATWTEFRMKQTEMFHLPNSTYFEVKKQHNYITTHIELTMIKSHKLPIRNVAKPYLTNSSFVQPFLCSLYTIPHICSY